MHILENNAFCIILSSFFRLENTVSFQVLAAFATAKARFEGAVPLFVREAFEQKNKKEGSAFESFWNRVLKDLGLGLGCLDRCWLALQPNIGLQPNSLGNADIWAGGMSL